MQNSEQSRVSERQSIWSVPGHLWRWYVIIFAIQYFAFLGLTIWDEVTNSVGIGTVQITLNVQKGMTAGILNMAASTYLVLEGIMLAQWLRERDERKRQEAIDRARKEADEEVKQWRNWYQRMQAAQREGLPFDELPPQDKDDSRKG